MVFSTLVGARCRTVGGETVDPLVRIMKGLVDCLLAGPLMKDREPM